MDSGNNHIGPYWPFSEQNPQGFVIEPLIIPNNQIRTNHNLIHPPSSPIQIPQIINPLIINLNSDDEEQTGPNWLFSDHNPTGFVIEPLIRAILPNGPNFQNGPNGNDENLNRTPQCSPQLCTTSHPLELDSANDDDESDDEK